MNTHYYATSDPATINGMEEFRARIKEARQLIAEKFRERLGVKDVVLMQNRDAGAMIAGATFEEGKMPGNLWISCGYSKFEAYRPRHRPLKVDPASTQELKRLRATWKEMLDAVPTIPATLWTDPLGLTKTDIWNNSLGVNLVLDKAVIRTSAVLHGDKFQEITASEYEGLMLAEGRVP